MEILDLTFPSGFKEDYLKELFVQKEAAYNLQFGTVFLKKGRRIPEEGFTHHDQKKIVFLMEGEIKILLEEKSKANVDHLRKGQVFMTDYKEGHGGIVVEDAKILFVLFGKNEHYEA